jgi:hypothetical protein
VTFDVVIAVWGARYRDLFLDVCVPNQLATGNLDALPPGSRYRIFTTGDDAGAFESSPALRTVAARMSVDVVVMPELSASAKSPFTRMTAAHRRALVDARASRSAVIVLCADHFISAGTFAAVVRRHAGGCRAVVCTGVRVNRDGFLARVAIPAAERGLSGRDLVAAAIDHLHPFTHAHMVDSERAPQRPIGVYWTVGGAGLLARPFHLHPLMVDPVRSDVLPDETIDGHFVRRACPDRADVHVVSDSDELVMFEMSGPEDGAIETTPGRLSPWRAASMLMHCDSHQESYWHIPVRLHAGEIDQAWSAIEQESDRFVRRTATLGAARRLLTLRHLKRIARHSVRGLKQLRKRSFRLGRIVRGRARRSVALLTQR